MKDIKEKLPLIIGIIVFIALCVVAYYFLFIGKTIYYTQIDNTKIQEITNSDMKYEYTLDCYKENGKKKTLKFKTSRQLRENAYLKIEYMKITGVHSWEEVQYKNLPKKVQENMLTNKITSSNDGVVFNSMIFYI